MLGVGEEAGNVSDEVDDRQPSIQSSEDTDAPADVLVSFDRFPNTTANATNAAAITQRAAPTKSAYRINGGARFIHPGRQQPQQHQTKILL
jgi:hypothetical protein